MLHFALPLAIVLFAAVSLLNEVSAQMVAPLILILIASVLAAGTAFGWYHMISGVAAIPAGLLFGLIWNLAGPEAAFGETVALALASALWLKLALPNAAAPRFHA